MEYMKQFYRVLQMTVLVTGTLYLFKSLPYVVLPPAIPDAPVEALPIFYPELVFLAASWFLLSFTVDNRLFMLVCLVAGQISLYFLYSDFWLLRHRLPFYVVIAGNGIFLLAVYFLLSLEKWAPEELKPEEFDSPW